METEIDAPGEACQPWRSRLPDQRQWEADGSDGVGVKMVDLQRDEMKVKPMTAVKLAEARA